jgi:hypothetical protein
MDDKGYYFYDRNQSISISEHDLVGKEMDEIEGFFFHISGRSITPY